MVDGALADLMDAVTASAAAGTLSSAARACGGKVDGRFGCGDSADPESLQRKDFGDIVGHRGGVCLRMLVLP